MKYSNAALAASIYDFTHVLLFIPDGGTPVPLCLGPLTINIFPGVVDGVVGPNLKPWTIRALISLLWSRWSRWSMQIQLIAHARAHARLYRLFSLICIFNLFKNTWTIWTKPILTRLFTWTIPWTTADHMDHMHRTNGNFQPAATISSGSFLGVFFHTGGKTAMFERF